MLDCLHLSKDREKVKNIFKTSEGNQDIFKLVTELVYSNKRENQRSRAENFAYAYSYEFLEDYISAAKSYLLLSRQQHRQQHNFESLKSFCFMHEKSQKI